MPLHWTITPEDRLVVASATGSITLDDMEAYFADVARAGAMPYAKIFDLTFFDGTTLREVSAAAARMVEYAGTSAVGPLAIVADTELREEVGRLFSSRARLDRPVGIFRDQAAAREWIRAGAGRDEPSAA